MKFKNCSKLFILTVGILLSMSSISNAKMYSNPNENRIYGKDRYETSVILSNKSFTFSDNVILLNNDNLSDTIDAFNASLQYNAPILLTNDKVEKLQKDEINRLSSKTILTNSESISKDKNFQTEKFKLKKLPKYYEYDNKKSALLVSNDVDAIISSTYARQNNMVIILINNNNKMETIKKIKEKNYEKIAIIGGKDSVPDIDNYFSNVKRIAGKDRYETSKLLLNESKSKSVLLTSGENISDSISSSSYAAKMDSSILLCNRDASNINVSDYEVKGIIGGLVKVVHNVYYLIPHQDDEVLYIGIDINRDVRDGHNVNAILFTDGSRTSAIKAINKKLSEQGLSEITSEDIVKARNKEITLALNHLEVESKKIEFLGYINKGLLKTDVSNVLDKIVKNQNNVVFKTLAVELLNHKDGSSDHLAITYATEDAEKKYNIPASYYIKSEWDSVITKKNYKAIHLNDSEKEIMIKALNAYTIWNPANGFYAVGQNSVPASFQNKISHPVYYIEVD